MPVKIRLTRHGRKKYAYYHIVVADSRAPRDGRFIERIGSYNPNTNPATINLNFEKTLSWLQNGAQPTDTCRAILSYKGVMMKKHLLDGVKKGAFDEAEGERRFETWLNEKENKVQAKKDQLQSQKDSDTKTRLEYEAKVNSERAEALAKKKADLDSELESKAKEAAAEAAAAEAGIETPEETTEKEENNETSEETKSE